MSTSGAIRFSTVFSLFTHWSSLFDSSPICCLDNTRGCTHVIWAFCSTWSMDPRISFRLRQKARMETSQGSASRLSTAIQKMVRHGGVIKASLTRPLMTFLLPIIYIGKAINSPQSFHDKMFYFIDGKPRLFANRLERHGSIVCAALKDRLDESHQTDLLSQECIVFLQD